MRIDRGRAVVLLTASLLATAMLAGCEPTTPAAPAAATPEATATANEAAQSTAPDLIGLPAASVVPALQAAGLFLGPTSYQASDEPRDTVISQDPAAGEAADAGSQVAVVLSSGPTQTAAPAPAAAGTALAALASLRVAGRGAKTGYARTQFGPSWYDVDRNGCDTRDDILKRDLTNRSAVGSSDCQVASGSLADPYTRAGIRFVRGGGAEVDIDHVVALGNAWVTGAARWPYSKRVALANDPLNLLAVSSSANRQKGDGDAATWLPSNKSFRCAYVARQVGVKAKYGLYVTSAEKDAIRRVLESCPSQKVLTGGGRTESGLTAPAASKSSGSTSSSGSKAASGSKSGVDADYGTCKAAKAAGKGPYVQGKDPEYNYYRDADSDGVVCE